MIDAVLAANPEQVETYRGGKEGVLGFLVGQVMRETQGKADPKVVNRLLREKLQASRARGGSRIEELNVPTTAAASDQPVKHRDRDPRRG